MLINAQRAEEVRVAILSEDTLDTYQLAVAEAGLVQGQRLPRRRRERQPGAERRLRRLRRRAGRDGRRPRRRRRGVPPDPAVRRLRPPNRPDHRARPRAAGAGHQGPGRLQGGGAHHQRQLRRTLSRADAVRPDARHLAQGRGRGDPRLHARAGGQARCAGRVRHHPAHKRARPDESGSQSRPRGPAPALEARPDRGQEGEGAAPAVLRPGHRRAGVARPPRRLDRRGAGRRRRGVREGRGVHARLDAARQDPPRPLHRAHAAVLEIRRRAADRGDLQPDRRRSPAAGRSSSTPPRRSPRSTSTRAGPRAAPPTRRASSRSTSRPRPRWQGSCGCATSAASSSSTSSTCARASTSTPSRRRCATP